MIERILEILPQTQCRQCGCDGCREYARAIAEGSAPINRCAPGGATGIAELAALLGRDALPLDPEYGREMPFAVAKIAAENCIGCHLCASACPVDAVTGVPKHLFAVIEEECTGCALCVTACPMSCISMHENGKVWTRENAAAARLAYERRLSRKSEIVKRENEERTHDEATVQNVLSDVMAMVRARKNGRKQQ